MLTTKLEQSQGRGFEPHIGRKLFVLTTSISAHESGLAMQYDAWGCLLGYERVLILQISKKVVGPAEI